MTGDCDGCGAPRAKVACEYCGRSFETTLDSVARSYMENQLACQTARIAQQARAPVRTGAALGLFGNQRLCKSKTTPTYYRAPAAAARLNCFRGTNELPVTELQTTQLGYAAKRQIAAFRFLLVVGIPLHIAHGR